MNKFPELKSPRLRLGKVRIKDIPRIAEYANNRKISDNTNNIPYPYTEDDAVKWVSTKLGGFESNGFYVFAIYIKETDEFAGAIGLHLDNQHNKAELGYWLAEPFWNNGYITEAAMEILDFGFNTLKLNKIYATHFISNTASERVMQKIGMVKEADLKNHFLKNGKYRDVRQYYITKTQYEDLL